MSVAKFLAASALAPLAFSSVPVLAQVPGATSSNVTSTNADTSPTAQPDSVAATNEIVVTGSRITRPNLQSTTPITSITGAELFQTGQISVGDQLNQLPQLGSTFGQSNSTRFLGTAGLNLLDLRNLGTQRTLVLVNGRRHVASDILNAGVSVDVNTIPTDLIERADIVTGGNSAVYGSDAIAGVVNFILKDKFDGLQVRGQGGLSSYGDAGAQFASVLAGKNFGDNRGNIAVNAEFAHQSQYFAAERPRLASQSAFLQVLPTGTGTAASPERLSYSDVRSASYSNTGVVRFGGNAQYNAGIGPNDVAYYVPYTFTPNGSLVPITGQRVGFGPNGAFIGGNGENFRGGQQLQLEPQLDRVNLNLTGHYSFSDIFEPFVEATWSHTHVLGIGGGGPAFINGGALGGDPRESIRYDNPYLTDQARGVITDNFLRADPTRVINGDTSFRVRETLLGLGLRAEASNRDTLRAVLGVRGVFNNDWKYEVSANYGSFKERTTILGNLNQQRFLLANDAVRNAAGQIVCRSQVDPTAGGTDLGGNPAVLAADIASCVPVNVLGGQFSNAQRNYVTQNTTSVGKITQFDVNGFVSGNLSRLFTLPGGPIGFSVGGEYRRETNFYQQDPLVSNGYTFYNAIPTFTAPGLEVKEAFGELLVPLVKDVLLLKELSLTAAGRVSSYNTKAKTVYTYNIGADWYPIQDIHFRANYGRAVRAPNLGELYTPAGQNYATVVDPCATDNLKSGPKPANRQANCSSAGRPAGYNFIYSNSLEIKSGGNPNLNAEKSDSYTYGFVLQPHWIRGLTASVDYYKIKVKNVIQSLDAQTILNQCYDSSSLANPYCAQFQRNGSGTGPRGEVPFQVLEASLLASSLNFAQLRASGIDAEAAYNHDFGNVGSVSLRLNYSHVLERDDYLDPTAPGNRTRVRGTLGVPIDKFRLISDFKHGPVTFGYTLRWIGQQYVDLYANYFTINGNPPADLFYADHRYYPVIAYHDLRVAVDVSKRFDFYLGVDNVAGKLPPYDLTGLGGESNSNGGGSGVYDVRGRFMYAGIEAKF